MPVRALQPELAEKATVELNEDPKKLEDGIRHLQEWITKQPHLRARKDNQWLAAFLRGCKFSLERTKEKIDLYYSIRSIAPEINCLKVSDKKFLNILKSGFVTVLPQTAKSDDPRVILLRAKHFDPEKYSHFEMMAVPQLLQQIMSVEDDNYVVSGVLSIIDLEGTSFAHFSQLSPVKIKKMIIAYQEAVPIRMKGAHCLNTPKVFETVYSIARSFLSEKMKNRLRIHNGFESLYQVISKDILPVEYGGNGGTIQEITDYWVKKVQEYEQWFEEDEQFGTDEKLRPGKPKTAEDMFGVEGSFRQLDFD